MDSAAKIMCYFLCLTRVVVVKLARTDEIQAAVVLYPGRITEDEIKGKFHTSQAHNMYVCVCY
ncbi:hypothetical protein ACSBR1_036786 [Camellia fascicularis]